MEPVSEFKSIREIAAGLIADYHRKYPNKPPIGYDEEKAIIEALKVTQMPAPVVKAAMQMEALLNDGDRDWLERLRIKV